MRANKSGNTYIQSYMAGSPEDLIEEINSHVASGYITIVQVVTWETGESFCKATVVLHDHLGASR